MAEIPSPTQDPSMSLIPPALAEAYAACNNAIGQDALIYGPIFQANHLNASHLMIAQTAEEAAVRTRTGQPREAIVLGSGQCLDIPLEQLTETFTSTTLVDVNTQATEAALSSLSSHQLSRVKLVAADITGFMGKLTTDISEALETQPGFDPFVTAVAEHVATMDTTATRPDLGGKYAFVCSQLLMTQLASIPYLQINGLIQRRFGQALGYDVSTPGGKLMLALNDKNLKLHTEHIAHLRELVAPNGAVHFADTYTQIYADGERPMVFPDLIEPEIQSRFTDIREPAGWVWRRSFNTGHFVVARALAPKPEAPEAA